MNKQQQRTRDQENYDGGITLVTVLYWKKWGWTLDERITERGRLNAYRYQRLIGDKNLIDAR